MSDFAKLIIIKLGIDEIGNDCFEHLRRWIEKEHGRSYVTITKFPSVFASEVNYLNIRTALIMILESKFKYPEEVCLIFKWGEQQDGWCNLKLADVKDFLKADLNQDHINHMWDDEQIERFKKL
jgi:hypothetical protein